MAKKDKNEQEYVITEEGVEQAVTSALEQYSEGEITKNDKKTNFFTLKMFGKNIGGAILGKNSKKEIEGKYLHNTEENVQNVTKLILDSAKKHKGIAIPPPIPVPVETQQNEQEQTTNKEQPKKRKIILPIAMATLIGGAIGAAIASRADTIIDNNNITIEYDSAENTLDALADLEQSSDDLIDEKLETMVLQFKNVGIDIKNEKIEVAPTAHHFMGGVKINSDCSTNVHNLFAAGEVSGGVHGANRLGGNALADTQVFGKRAGESAAKVAIKTDFKENPEMVHEEKTRIESLIKEGSINPIEFKNNLKKLMWEKVGIVRDEKNLNEALRQLQEMEKELNNLKVENKALSLIHI